MEVWKDVVGYEGCYVVSSLGEIKSLTRTNCNNKYRKTFLGKLLNQQIDKNGYKSLVVYKNGAEKRLMAHRLVAMAFIPNHDNKPCVNHKDSNRTNNKADNLEWVTHKENMQHASQKGRMAVSESEKRKLGLRSKELYSKPVIAINIETGDKLYFKSMMEAERNGFRNGSISNCCKNKIKTHYGHEWRYANGT